MAVGKIVIGIDVESVAKLWCSNIECRFNMLNLHNREMPHCQLKVVEIGKNGKCVMQEKFAAETSVEREEC